MQTSTAKTAEMRPVVEEAERILEEIRGKALYLIPFRMIDHLPDHATIIRPVDTLRVTFIGTGIGSNGFRKHEPCCTNDPIPDIGVKRYILSENRRQASTRDSGQVLVPTNRIPRKKLRTLMRLLKNEDQKLIDAGALRSHYSDRNQAHQCLQILAVSLQGLEPAPKPLSCLQQVQLVRTAFRNDPSIDYKTARPAAYGGTNGLRSRIFLRHRGTDDSSIHFLLNNKIGPRHKNKLVAGAKVLIFTECKFKLPEVRERTSIFDVFNSMGVERIHGTVLGRAPVLYWTDV